MELRKADCTAQLQTFEKYETKSLDELQKIKPRWACEKNADKVLDQQQATSNNRYTIIWVNVTVLINNSIFNEVDLAKLFTGNNINDTRIARILERWDKKLYVDPPTVFISNLQKDKVEFSDGRHRAKLTHFLNHKEIPIAVENCDVNSVIQILALNND